MHEGIFESSFTEDINRFKETLPEFLGQDIEDLIGWI